MYLLLDVDLSGGVLVFANLALTCYTAFCVIIYILNRRSGYSIGKIILMLFGSFFLLLDYSMMEDLLSTNHGVLKVLCRNDPTVVIWQNVIFYVSIVVLYLLPMFLKRMEE